MIPYTTIPLISAFFLVFVGVLIGHFIWYRYRDEQEHRATGLRRQIDDLRSSLDIQTGEFTQANTRIAEFEQALESEREKSRDLMGRLEEHTALYESAATDLGKSERINVELREQLDQEAQKRIEFEEQTAASKRQIDELAETLSLAENDRNSSSHRLDELTSVAAQKAEAVEQLQTRNEQLVAENQKLESQLGERKQEITRLQARDEESSVQLAESTGLREECERVSTMLRELQVDFESERESFEAERNHLQAQVEQLASDNEELRNANSEYASQLESQITLANDLSGKVSAALLDLGRLEKNAENANSLKEDRDRLIDELDERQVEIKRLTEDLDAACASDDQTRQELKQVREDREKLESDLRDVSARQQEADAKLNEDSRRRQSLERALASSSEELAQLQVERERLEGVEDEVVELDAKLRKALADLKLAKTEREEAMTAESSTREIVVELRDELQDRLESVQTLEQQKDSALASLESEIVNRQRTTAEMEKAAADRDRLSSELEVLRRAESEQGKELGRVTSEFERLNARYEQAAAQIKLYQQRISDFEAASGSTRDERKRASLLGRTSPAKSTFSFRQVQRKEEVVRAEDKTKVRRDDRLGVLFAEPPFRSDDLMRIRGISTMLSQKLNSLGVYTFKQVMEWDAVAIEEISKRIGCDKISDQDWVGQARRLFHQSYRAAA